MSASTQNKYLLLFPILGLLFYYVGGVLTSLDTADMMIFLLMMAGFSAVEIIGLALRNKVIVIIGALLLVLFSAGPIAALLGALSDMAMLGGIIMAVADIFHLLSIFVWIKS